MKILISKTSIIIILICQKFGSVKPVKHKIKLPLPNSSSYDAKELEKPSLKVSLFKLKNLMKRCLSQAPIKLCLLCLYIYILLIFFRGQKFHLISCHKPKNNQCITKCYQYFSNRMKIYFSNTSYNLSTDSI